MLVNKCESRLLPFIGKLAIPALPLTSYTTKHAKFIKKRLRKRKRQQELLRGKINESCKCDDLERREEIVAFAIKVTLCFELS